MLDRTMNGFETMTKATMPLSREVHSIVLVASVCVVVAFASVMASPANGQDAFQPIQTPQNRPTDAPFPRLIAPDDLSLDASGKTDDASATGFAAPVITTISALLIVLSLFAGLVWISRRYGGNEPSRGALPQDVLQNLGSTALDAKTRVSFLKLGDRILVVAQTQTGDPQTLAEITDPDEISRVTNRCMGRPEIIGRRVDPAAHNERTRRDYPVG